MGRLIIPVNVFLVILISSFWSGTAFCQVKINGEFLKDSIKIGEKVGFALSASYPRTEEVVFPDSLYDFGTYELVNKRYFPTVTLDSLSYDSTIYEFITFELDTVQTLSLPVFLIGPRGDSLVFNSPEDQVIIRQLVETVPDSVSAESAPLIENTDFIRLPLAFNYPYFIAGAILLLLLAILTYIFFGKKISKYFTLRRLEKAHAKFVTRFDEIRQQEFTPEQVKQVDQLWKVYFEKLLGVPFTKMTTKEILNSNWANAIDQQLRSIDRILYSGRPISEFEQPGYEHIKTYAGEMYAEKVKEVNSD